MKSSLIQRMPAWALSLITTVLSFILVFGVAALLEGLKISGNSGELILNLLLFLFVAASCFLICRIHPRSFWYVPVLCNLITIISAIAEPLQLTPDWFLIMGGWGLSILAALLGSGLGKRGKLRQK